MIMKRFLICILFGGLFLNGHAVTLVVERIQAKPVKQEFVRSIIFSPNQTLHCTLYGGDIENMDSVRTILFEDIYTAVENVPTVSTVKVYPNPTASALIIDGATGSGIMNIYSLNGTLIHSQAMHEGTNTINVSNLLDGLYILKLPNESFKFTKK